MEVFESIAKSTPTAQTATITDSGFGTKASTTPYFEDFENVALGSLGLTTNNLKLSQTGGTSCSAAKPHSGSRGLYHDYSSVDFPKMYVTLDGTELYFYLAAWIYWDGVTSGTGRGDNSSVWKFCRVGNDSAPYSGNPKAKIDYVGDNDAANTAPESFGIECIDGDGTNRGSTGNNTASPTLPDDLIPSNWNFYEFEGYFGTINSDPTPNNWEGDSVFIERFNNVETVNWQNRVFRRGAGQIPTWLMGPLTAIDGVHPINMYMDDFYTDQTRNRVVMTDNATYASSTKWAVQPVVSWSDTSITVTKKRQSFAVNDTAYYHVFDSSGTLVHSSGSFTVTADT